MLKLLHTCKLIPHQQIIRGWLNKQTGPNAAMMKAFTKPGTPFSC